MHELVVASGKGGTGKTSVVAAFASLAPGAVFADCDVDAADLHLVLKPRVERREDFSAGHVAVICQNACVGCGRCVELCRFNAIDDNEEGFFEVDETACEGCGVCVRFCPMEAIDFPEKVCGKWFVSETDYGPMVHAKLGIAEENSGKLVSQIRKQAREIADKRGRELVVADGSPGIGCPVIASLAGANMVLAVAEPTLSGLHDFERVAELAAKLDVKGMVCTNKADINPDVTELIERAAAKHGFTVAGRIPYDEEVTTAQIDGHSIVEHSNGPASRAVKDVWTSVERELMADVN